MILALDKKVLEFLQRIKVGRSKANSLFLNHGLGTPGEEIAFTAQPKINSHFQIFYVRPKHIVVFVVHANHT